MAPSKQYDEGGQLQLMEADRVEEEEEECFESIDKLISQGINSGDVKKLQDAGIYTCNGLMMHTKKSLGIKGLTEENFEKICQAAEKLMQKSVVRITTGSQALDELFGGGIETLCITEAFGDFRSGKTWLAHTLCVSTQLPLHMHGENGKVAYIDTKGTFCPERIMHIVKRFGMDANAVDKLRWLPRACLCSGKGQEMKIKKLMRRKSADWMEKGDSLDNKYLKTLVFCVSEEEEGSRTVEYAFLFSNPSLNDEDVSVKCNCQSSGTDDEVPNRADVTPDEMRFSLQHEGRVLRSKEIDLGKTLQIRHKQHLSDASSRNLVLTRIISVALVFIMMMNSASLASATTPAPCEVNSLIANVRMFCMSNQPTSTCCESLRAAVMTHGGRECLCDVGNSPDIITLGFTAENLLMLYSECTQQHDRFSCENPEKKKHNDPDRSDRKRRHENSDEDDKRAHPEEKVPSRKQHKPNTYMVDDGQES